MPPTPEVAFWDDGVVRLRYVPREARPSYAVVAPPRPDVAVRVERRGDLAIHETSELRLEIGPGTLRALDRDGAVLLEDRPGALEEGAGRRTLRRPIAPGERFYGLGEKTGPLDRRGRALVMWNTDCYDPALGGYRAGSDPLYQSIPLLIGLRGGTAYGLLVDDTHRLRLDLGAADPDVCELASQGGALDQWLLAGPRLADVLRRYTWLTGRIPLPPRWALGYHQSRWGYWPDEEVRRVCRELRARDLACDGIWLDIQHLDGYRSFTWDPVGFPRPRALLSELAADGFKAVVIADPGLKVDPGWDPWAEALRDGHLLGREGAPFVGRVWPGDAAWPDFTRPAARAFWGRLAARAVTDGARGVWIDMNEPANQAGGSDRTVPDDLPADGDGVPTTMAEAHNVYGLLMARATFEGLSAAAPGRRPFVLTRAGAAGIQRFAAVWTGDAPSRWDVLAETPALLAGLGLSGCALVGSDVGGFSGDASPELYARWMQLGALSPFFRAHCRREGQPQEPWALGAEVERISRAAIRARYALLPYLYGLVAEAARTGAPPLRPLVWDFQDDPRTHALGDQLMLGPWLLAAPVLAPGVRERELYLPAGRWIDLASGAVHHGPADVRVPAPLDVCPTFLREGAVVPRCEPLAWSDQRPLARLELECFPGPAATAFTLHEDDGESLDHERGVFSRVTYRLARAGGRVTLEAGAREGTFAPAARTLAVRVREVGDPAAVRLGGALLPRAAATSGEGFWYDAATRSVHVVCDDRPGLRIEIEEG